MFKCTIPMQETFLRVMTEFVKPAFDEKSTDGEVGKGLRSEEAQAMFASYFDLLMVVYKHYACIDTHDHATTELSAEGGEAEQRYRAKALAAAHARPSMNLGEFQAMIQDAGLCMTETDRTRVKMVAKKQRELERRRRYARGKLSHHHTQHTPSYSPYTIVHHHTPSYTVTHRTL
jgi:hypothetical protein